MQVKIENTHTRAVHIGGCYLWWVREPLRSRSVRDTSLSSVTCSEEPYLSSLSDLSPARALFLLSIFSCSDTNTNTSMNSENTTANITRITKTFALFFITIWSKPTRALFLLLKYNYKLKRSVTTWNNDKTLGNISLEKASFLFCPAFSLSPSKASTH